MATAALDADSALDLPNIAQVRWLPSLHQLPALDQRGAAVEQFRSLRSRMQEFRDLNTLKSILVSSGLPQEGKSFVAANLAISFARHKAARVLLIDGDMRRASLHKLLGAPPGPGLTEYLAGKAGLIRDHAAPYSRRHRPSPARRPGLADLHPRRQRQRQGRRPLRQPPLRPPHRRGRRPTSTGSSSTPRPSISSPTGSTSPAPAMAFCWSRAEAPPSTRLPSAPSPNSRPPRSLALSSTPSKTLP